MLIQSLKQVQATQGLTDTEMAARLGYSRVYWNNLKNGRAKANDKVEMKAYRAFPDIFLPHQFTEVNEDLIEVTPNAPQRHYNLWERASKFFCDVYHSLKI